MAEGGSDFGYTDPDLDNQLDHEDDDDEHTEYEFHASTFGHDQTTPFNPNGASTPAPVGEQIEMQTMQYEQSGLPDKSYLEMPLLRDFSSDEDRKNILQRAIDRIKKFKPNADFSKIGPIGFSKRGNKSEIVTFGSKGGEGKIFKKDGSLLKSFTDKFSKALGQSAEEIIVEDRNTIREQRQRLAEAEEQERQAISITAEKEKEEQEMQNFILKTERTQARIDAIQDEHGSNLETETELNRLKQLKKNYQTESENKKKRIGCA